MHWKETMAVKERVKFMMEWESPRRYPRRLLSFEVEPWNKAMLVDKNGFVHWDRKPVFLTTALARGEVGRERVRAWAALEPARGARLRGLENARD